MDIDTAFFSNLHVVILSSPGMGHLIPALVLGNRLAAHHHVSVTVLLVTVSGSPPESNLLKLPLHPLVQIQNLPPVDISHLVDSSGTRVVTQLCLMVRSALPSVRSAIAAMEPRPDALIVDIFGTDVLPIAAEFCMPKYVYSPSHAWIAALTVYCPVLHHEIEGEYIDQKEPIKIPGCKPVRPDDVVDPMLDRSEQQYDEFLMMGKQFPSFDGILINSWKDLDPETLHAMAETEAFKSIIKIPVYPVGPLTRQPEPEDSSSRLTAWLDRQPNESVIFVSFGSGGVLSQDQMTELAWGLELSRQRFVWVVRPPTTGRVDGGFFSVTTTSDGGPNYLPDGFMTRVHNMGFLVPSWAQQAQILAHPAVGGFLTHCGWNSTLESITNGVPMIAWPLYAEQKMNVAFLSEEAGVALRPQRSQVLVGREEIEKMVRELMEEKEIREGLKEKVKQLKMSGSEALKQGGSAHKSMCQLLTKIASK